MGLSSDKVLRRVLRREPFTEGAWKVLRRQCGKARL